MDRQQKQIEVSYSERYRGGVYYHSSRCPTPADVWWVLHQLAYTADPAHNCVGHLSEFDETVLALMSAGF